MKAMVTKELVLLYGIEEKSERGQEIVKLLHSMRADAKFIGADALGQSVGYLCGLPGYPKQETPAIGDFRDELLILSGFSGARLNQLLGLFRSSGVRKVELKAAVTNTNCGWTFLKLADEIRKEHEYMKKI